MTDPVWPSSLPAPRAEGFSEEIILPVRGFTPDMGPEIVRKTGTADYANVQAVFRLSPEQCDVLDSFILRDLSSGVLPFLMTHPRTGALARWRLRAGSSSSLKIRPVAPHVWDYSLELTRLPE